MNIDKNEIKISKEQILENLPQLKEEFTNGIFKLENYNIIQEGQCQILISQQEGDIFNNFYNFPQIFERDVSLFMVHNYISQLKQEYKSNDKQFKGVTIFNGNVNSGIKSLRYLKELCPDDIKVIYAQENQDNFEYCNNFLFKFRIPFHLDDKLDIIDIDSHGSSLDHIEFAIRGAKQGGLIMATFSDLRTLCGPKVEKCSYQYNSVRNNKFEGKHENGIRIIYQTISKIAGLYGKYIQPEISYFSDFYIRVSFRVYKSRIDLTKLSSQLAIHYQCKQCPNQIIQPFGQINYNERIERNTAIPNQLKKEHLKCSVCNGEMVRYGPIWSDSLNNINTIQQLNGNINLLKQNQEEYNFDGANMRLQSQLKMKNLFQGIENEMKIVDTPYTVNFRQIHKFIQGKQMIDNQALMRGIRSLGYKFVQSYINSEQFKTDAPMKVCLDVVKRFRQVVENQGKQIQYKKVDKNKKQGKIQELQNNLKNQNFQNSEEEQQQLAMDMNLKNNQIIENEMIFIEKQGQEYYLQQPLQYYPKFKKNQIDFIGNGQDEFNSIKNYKNPRKNFGPIVKKKSEISIEQSKSNLQPQIIKEQQSVSIVEYKHQSQQNENDFSNNDIMNRSFKTAYVKQKSKLQNFLSKGYTEKKRKSAKQSLNQSINSSRCKSIRKLQNQVSLLISQKIENLEKTQPNLKNKNTLKSYYYSQQDEEDEDREQFLKFNEDYDDDNEVNSVNTSQDILESLSEINQQKIGQKNLKRKQLNLSCQGNENVQGKVEKKVKQDFKTISLNASFLNSQQESQHNNLNHNNNLNNILENISQINEKDEESNIFSEQQSNEKQKNNKQSLQESTSSLNSQLNEKSQNSSFYPDYQSNGEEIDQQQQSNQRLSFLKVKNGNQIDQNNEQNYESENFLIQKPQNWNLNKANSNVLNKDQWDELHVKIESRHQEKLFDRVLYQRVNFQQNQKNEFQQGCEYLLEAISLRQKYMEIFDTSSQNKSDSDSFFVEFKDSKQEPTINWKKKYPLYKKLEQVKKYINNYMIQQFIKILNNCMQYELVQENGVFQFRVNGKNPFKYFSKQEFIKDLVTLETEEGDRKVYQDQKSKQVYTLKEVFQKLNIDPDRINMDTLSVKADNTIFQRFDNFNNKFAPLKSVELRWIFFGGRENYIQGQYLGELSKILINSLEENNIYQEWRFSICGRQMNEWEQFAKWIDENDLYSQKLRWMIQVPRSFDRQKLYGLSDNFQQMLDRIFKPMFEVTLNPESDPVLFQTLCYVSGFDSVDDESIPEKKDYLGDFMLDPAQFEENHNPHYLYYSYYFYANLHQLNQLRISKGLNAFKYRPHSGESGDINHLASSFLLANGINHGIQLINNKVLQYLFYLQQIGLAMSPLSNNKLFLKYKKNPFDLFFKIGLNVSLSTDDPLIMHLTKQPLLEEYAIAAQIWNYCQVDLCEIARYSIIQSSLPEEFKKYWIGNYTKLEPESNYYQHSNLPPSRYLYRLENLKEEFIFLFQFGEEFLTKYN
ncbi:hypothetical protein PPERSA_02007 [Pseudocohnilembus persalinus]|uniref:AMP deaminase n=1 Tax=Pseudocohnilembus persalinus TaxID=266149 RepID=A0A0V0QF90_PSEPJ|nr:hypothetical protein PPERSA_02007 [Pseudocohnilembus persalinus]|eukprot:KRX00828.1 hypothetical protein PPERSA_02007 [Pseudocohnilembus persalinus]